MKDLKVQALQYWHGLTVREKRLAAAGGIALVIWLVFFAVVRPAMKAEQDAFNRLATNKAQLSQVKDIAREITDLRAAGVVAVAGHQPLDSLINRSAALEKISLKGISQQNNSIQVKVDTVAFVKLMSWLKTLDRQGVKVNSLQVSRTDKPGTVEVQHLRVSRKEAISPRKARS